MRIYYILSSALLSLSDMQELPDNSKDQRDNCWHFLIIFGILRLRVRHSLNGEKESKQNNKNFQKFWNFLQKIFDNYTDRNEIQKQTRFWNECQNVWTLKMEKPLSEKNLLKVLHWNPKVHCKWNETKRSLEDVETK